MTSLNNKLRDQIVESVIQKGTDIPNRKTALKKATELRVRKLCLECVPKEFGPATKNLPPEWFPLMATEKIPYPVAPYSLATMTDEDIRRHSWSGEHVSFEPFRHPINTRFDRPVFIDAGSEMQNGVRVKKPNNEGSWEEVLADLIKQGMQIREDETQARAELKRFLWSVKTYKQVLEKMPELEPHLPDYVKPMPLVVSVAPILKTLGKLGFDKSTEKA